VGLDDGVADAPEGGEDAGLSGWAWGRDEEVGVAHVLALEGAGEREGGGPEELGIDACAWHGGLLTRRRPVSWAMGTVFWTTVVLAGLGVVLYGGFAVLTFVAGVWERVPVLDLRRHADPPAPSAAATRHIEQALALGYSPPRVYAHEGSLKSTWVISFMVAPDGLAALMIVHAPLAGRKHGFFTLLRDGRTIRTFDVAGPPDLTGLVDGAMLPNADVAVMEFYHRERTEGSRDDVHALTPETVADEVSAVEALAASALVEKGLARWENAERTRYRLTPRAAARVALGVITGPFGLARAQRLAREKAVQYRAASRGES
jgi:hypothetical protein